MNLIDRQSDSDRNSDIRGEMIEQVTNNIDSVSGRSFSNINTASGQTSSEVNSNNKEI